MRKKVSTLPRTGSGLGSFRVILHTERFDGVYVREAAPEKLARYLIWQYALARSANFDSAYIFEKSEGGGEGWRECGQNRKRRMISFSGGWGVVFCGHPRALISDNIALCKRTSADSHERMRVPIICRDLPGPKQFFVTKKGVYLLPHLVAARSWKSSHPWRPFYPSGSGLQARSRRQTCNHLRLDLQPSMYGLSRSAAALATRRTI